MQRNQKYASFRSELTAEQSARVNRAKNPMVEYGRIAIEEATKQLALAENTAAGQNALPDEEDICLRFPGVDPRGEYSGLDMALKQRTQVIDSALEQREAARRVVQPGEASVFFPDFDNVLLQALFSMPEHWGLSIEELEALRDEE